MLLREPRLYTRDYRLADVLALIQVLAIDQLAHRDEESLVIELQGKPRSAGSWRELASEHPEFFRVKSNAFNAISLVARHVSATSGELKGRPQLTEEMTRHLLSTAIELHDRQIRREDRFWSITVPVWAAVIAGLFAVFLKFCDFVVILCRAAH